MTKAKSKARKPRAIEIAGVRAACDFDPHTDPNGMFAWIIIGNETVLNAEQARRLAAWLIRAADWLERKER